MTKTENKYHIYTLENGLRAVICQTESNVSYIGALVNAGSRDEGSGLQGLAHFVEHTIFKGTISRKSWHISNRMESIGGELNAYTTKEETMIYTNAPAGYADRSFELLADLIMNAQFPKTEIEREKEVVIEEIHSYRDSPSDLVFDEFEERIYAGSALAHNILGSEDSVRKLTSADARNFIDSKYFAENIVLYCCDPGDPETNLRKIKKYFGGVRASGVANQRVEPSMVKPFDDVVDKNNYQANCILGCRLFGREDPRRHAMFLLNNYLAGPCMNSRLNMELRDRRGLVYTVESSVALMSDTGVLFIYFGTDPKATGKCRKIIANEIDRLAQSCLSERKFTQIRDQYCGQLIVGAEQRENQAMSLAKSLLYYKEVHDIDFTSERIRSLKPEDLREAAEFLASSQLNFLSIQ